MEKQELAKMLRDRILEIEQSQKDGDINKRVVTVNITAEVFLKMAYLYVGINLE